MKKVILSLICAWSLFQAASQKVYFIYLQTEPEQPFYVRMKDRVYQSGATGYLVLSNLRDTVQTFSVGFPGNTIPEQKFSVNILSRDHGFIIKNFPEKGWGLFNLQSLAVQMPVVEELKSEITETTNKLNKSEPTKFTLLLAKAVDDSSLLKSPPPLAAKTEKREIIQQQYITTKAEDSIVEKPAETTTAAKDKEADQKKEQLIAEKKDAENSQEAPEKIVGKETLPGSQYQKSEVKKHSESSTTEGFGLTFIDQYANGASDTIRIIIPNPSPAFKEIIPDLSNEKKILEIASDTAGAGGKLPADDKNMILDSVAMPPVAKESAPAKPIPRNNCKDLASEKDVQELKAKITANIDEEGKLDESKRYFKLICFSTQQIRQLSILFLSDEAKYRFFDAAYSYVIDLEHYPALQSELKDEYYINRFRAMLK